MAKAASIPVMATTLTIGPKKNSKEINALGLEMAESYRLAFLEADFKKRDGFLKSLQKSRSLGLYRQDYCGCRFSMPRR
jgi:predicted adenine nucleotide alpha hydrolase (AANH) superfamily ATPase